MRNFKKAVAATLSFIFVLSLFSFPIIGFYFHRVAYYDTDLGYRNELSGSLDFLVIGSSATKRGFIPGIIDNKLSASSYNASGSYVSPSGKQVLLEEEIDRNPINTVVLEVCDEDLKYSDKVSKNEGDIYILPHINTLKKRAKYFFNNVNVGNYMYFYSIYVEKGIKSLKNFFENKLTGVETLTTNYEGKGFERLESKDLFLDNKSIVSSYRTKHMDLEKNENYEKIAEIIKTCQSRNIEVVLVTVPVAEMIIWQRYSYDSMNEIISNLADEYGCEYFNFNLIKNRNKVLNDRDSFADYGHLSSTGAEAFTNCFCDVMKKLQNGEDVSDMFYDSYEEAITHFEYYDIYQRLTQEK